MDKPEKDIITSYSDLQKKNPDAKSWTLDKDGNFMPLYY